MSANCFKLTAIVNILGTLECDHLKEIVNFLTLQDNPLQSKSSYTYTVYS